MTEYAELKAQAADFDPVELYKARQVIRPAQEKAAEQQLEARQLIMHRNQEQYRNSLSKRKRNDPER